MAAHDLQYEARAILQRAAVIVAAVVDRRAEELRDQVTVRPVQFDAVEAGLPGPPRAGGERLHGLLDCATVMRSHSNPCSGSDLSVELSPFAIFDARDVALPAAVAELQDETAVVFVHPLAELAPERDSLVPVDSRVIRHDAAAEVHRDEGRDDRADTAARELHLPVDARLVAGAVVIIETTRDVRTQDSIFDR